MTNVMYKLIQSEIKLSLRQVSSWLTPLLFFVIVICLFPIALGPDKSELIKVAPAIIWVTCLLAVVISIGNLFRHDAQEGFLDLLLISPHSLTMLALAKIFSHWIMHCLPLILISPLLGLLLGLSIHQENILFFTLLLGTPILSLLGAIGAALTVGIRTHGLLLPILIMPLYIPVLILGTSTLLVASTQQPISAYLAMMGALLLLCLGFSPLLTAISLRISAMNH